MSALNFNTANQTFRQLLGNGLTYRVPPFQRDYSWTEDEWEDLWQDILGLFSEDSESAHYLGYLVLQSSDSKQFEIIDGQQRLSTISILILAALGHLQNLVKDNIDAERNQRRKDNLQNSYIGYVDPVSLISRSKLELNRHNNRFYQTYMVPLETMPKRGLNASEHLLRRAFDWFQTRIVGYCQKDGTAVAAFLDTMVDKLFFTVITVTDELNAFKVFETLNSRGVRLSATDLLKNYLFSIVSSGDTHETELSAIEERWERIVDELGSESFPEFLRVYWNSCNPLVRKVDLFKTIRKQIVTRGQVFDLLRSLDKSASIYATLRDPQDSSLEASERQSLDRLLMFNVRQPLAMLIAAYRKFIDVDRPIFTRLLHAVTVISFRYNVICNLPPQDQEKIYNSVANKISNGTLNNWRSIINALQDIYPEDRLFSAAFQEKEFKTTASRNKKVVRYILFQIEKHESGQEFEFESAAYNLEHILPENPSAAWSHMDEHNQDRFVYRIGNMTPLEKKTNRNIGNKGYLEKIAAFQESCFSITQALPDRYTEWNESTIAARQNQLAKIATAIWRIDFGN
ncbi:DUF262 domain-containing HNH endonuclease family protein [Chamaesiphon sp. VAR_69_metabat_338]|uniref:DUF262 domain-containing protein n=1 Tax=Chamaesiphon sp. VAR_69_metabat_338 TaxID=2964704 RepID=UPI00286E06F2|nr:DUF262 domain-containing HNH endonuclease family protein [Chamaesiphon sp. VAR_69_metabat_338]